MAGDTVIASPFEGLQGLLNQVLGSTTNTSTNKDLSTEQLLQSILTNNQTQNNTTSGTQSTDALTQLLSHLSGTTKQNADVSSLQKVFAQQQAGVTPEMLKAIFTEGSKAVPQLVATSANAVGARASDNSPLSTNLRDLSTNLTSQAATINQQMLKDSATTAGQIADLTKSTTTAQDNTQNTTNNTTQTSQQLVQSILDSIQKQNQTSNTTQNQKDDTKSTVGINIPQTAGAASLAGLVSLLNGGTGSGALGGITDFLKNLFSGSTGTGSIDGSLLGGGTSNELNLNPLDPNGSGFTAPGTGDYSNGYDSGIQIPDVDDWSSGFKDGGIVQPKLLSINDKEEEKPGGLIDPKLAQLIALAGVLGKGMTSSSPSKTNATGDSKVGVSVNLTDSPVAQKGVPDSGWYLDDPQVGFGDSAQYGDQTPWGSGVAGSGDSPLDPGNVYQLASPEQLASIGYKGTSATRIDNTGGGDNAREYVDPDFIKFLKDNGIKQGTRVGNADKGDPYIYSQFFDKDGKALGIQNTMEQDDHPGLFGTTIFALAALAGGAAAGGLAAGAGYGAGTAAGAAATGAGSAVGGTLASSADVGLALKNGAIGAVTGGIASGANLPGQFGITNPVASGAINGAVRGGTGALLNGRDPLDGIVMGGVKGAVPGVRKEIGMADGGVIPTQSNDPTGTGDTLAIRVSGGEAILPTDVVNHLGSDFIHSLITLFHTPSNA